MASSTFNPDANVESTSVDGYVAYEPGTGTWATLRASVTGTGADDSAASASALYIRQVAPSANYDIWRRAFFLFDTSALPDTAVISAATFSVYVNSKGDTIGGTPQVNVVSSSPASNTALGVLDFNDTGTTALATAINLSSITTGARNTWTLNASGIAAINVSGVTKLGLVFEHDRSNTEPTWASNGAEWYMNLTFADNGSDKPELVVTYTTATNNDKMFMVF